MNGLLKKAKASRKAQRLRQWLGRAIDRVRDTLTAPGPQLQPIPVRSRRRKG